MKAKALLIAVLLMASFNSFATPAKKETLEELFRLMNMTNMLDAVYAQSDAIAKKMAGGNTLTEAQKPIAAKYAEKSLTLMREEMSWDKLKSPMMSVYARVYSDKEVKDMIKFYQTSTGKKMLEKMPELSQAAMGMVHNMLQSIQPKMKALQAEMAAEMEKSSPQEAVKEAMK